MIGRRTLLAGLGAAALVRPAAAVGGDRLRVEADVDVLSLPPGAQPERIASDPTTGAIWFTARGLGALGLYDPDSRETTLIPLGSGARPRGLVSDGAGRLYVLDPALNAIHQVDAGTQAVRRFDLRGAAGYVQLMHAVVDDRRRVWFTGYAGVLGMLDPESGRLQVRDAPTGRGAHGIAIADGRLWITSFASDAILTVNVETGTSDVRSLPRHLSGPKGLALAPGAVWVSCSRSGALGRFDPRTRLWSTLRLAGRDIRPYALARDPRGRLWVADETGGTLLRVDPEDGAIAELALDLPRPAIRHLVFDEERLIVAASGADRLIVVSAR